MDMVSKQNLINLLIHFRDVLVHMDMVSKQNDFFDCIFSKDSFSSHGYGIKTKL